VCYSSSIMDLLEEVKKIQVEQGLTDSKMAELLGYKQRENWSRIKLGRAPANEVFQMRVLRAFPGFCTTPAEKPQGSSQRGVKAILDKIVLVVKKYL